nr:glycine betaine ABC transporter substrate-binding protein [Acetobacter papayae]
MTTLTLAYPESTVHEATAAAIIRVLEANDVEPEIVTGPKSILATMLKNQEIDLYVSAWLPDEDGALLTPGVLPLGTLFHSEICCCIPGENAAYTSLADLAQAGPELSRTIITPASLVAHMEKVLDVYGLAAAGFTLAPSPDAEAIAPSIPF